MDFPLWQHPKTGPTDRLRAFFRAHPNRSFAKAELAERTGLTRTQVSASITQLTRWAGFERAARGIYRWDDQPERDAAELAAREAEQRARAEAAARAATFTRITEDRWGRAVLLDQDDTLWVAIRAEPGDQPQLTGGTSHR